MTRLLFSPIVTLSLRPGRGPNGGLISKHRIALLWHFPRPRKVTSKVRAFRPRPLRAEPAASRRGNLLFN